MSVRFLTVLLPERVSLSNWFSYLHSVTFEFYVLQEDLWYFKLSWQGACSLISTSQFISVLYHRKVIQRPTFSITPNLWWICSCRGCYLRLCSVHVWGMKTIDWICWWIDVICTCKTWVQLSADQMQWMVCLSMGMVDQCTGNLTVNLAYTSILSSDWRMEGEGHFTTF